MIGHTSDKPVTQSAKTLLNHNHSSQPACCHKVGENISSTMPSERHDCASVWSNPADDFMFKQSKQGLNKNCVHFKIYKTDVPIIGKTSLGLEKGIPKKIQSTGAQKYSKKDYKQCYSLKHQPCAFSEKKYACGYSEDTKLQDYKHDSRSGSRIPDTPNSKLTKQKKVLIPTHNLAILPANCLLFHGRRFSRRPMTPRTPDDVVSSTQAWDNWQQTPEQVAAESPRTPCNSMKRLCREKINSSEYERHRRKCSAVVLPRIRYDGDTTSEDDDTSTEGERISEKAESQTEQELVEENLTDIALNRSKIGLRSPVSKMSSSFSIEKMTLKAIPVAEVKDLTENQNEYPWRDRKDRRHAKTSKLEAAQRIRKSDFVTFHRKRHDEEEYKYRMPHLDDNVRTMMNSTPFWTSRNRYKLKPPQSLESIRAHLVNKHSIDGYEDCFESGIISPSKDAEISTLLYGVHPQSPHKAKQSKSEKSKTSYRENMVASERIRQETHLNAFVRNSSDFCTPFCSNLHDAEFFHEHFQNNGVLDDEDTPNTFARISPKEVSPMDGSKRFERTFRDSQKKAEKEGCVDRSADGLDYQNRYVVAEKNLTDAYLIRSISQESECRENECNETVNHSTPRCSSPIYTMTKSDKISFPPLPKQNISVSALPRCSLRLKNDTLPKSLDPTNHTVLSYVNENPAARWSRENQEVEHHGSPSRLKTDLNSREKYVAAGNSLTLENNKSLPLNATEESILSSSNMNDSRTLSLLSDQKESNAQGCQGALDGETETDTLSFEIKQQKNANKGSELHAPLKRRTSQKYTIRKKSNVNFVIPNKIQSDGHKSCIKREKTRDSSSENSLNEQQNETSKAQKPPLRRRVRYKNLASNPEFVLFRSLEVTTVDNDSAANKTLNLTGELEAGLKVDDTQLTFLRGSQEVCQSFTPARLVRRHSKELNNHLVTRISELERLRGYSGPDAANLGLEEYHHEHCMRTQSRGVFSFLRQNNISPSYTAYNGYENTKQRPSRQTSWSRSVYSSNQDHFQEKRISHRNRNTKSQRRGPCREKAKPTSKSIASSLSRHADKTEVSFGDTESVYSPERISTPPLKHKGRSASCPGREPRLYHHPSCPEVQKRRSLSQHNQRALLQALEKPALDSKQSEAMKARLAFNNMRLIHNARQGAFSKFYFSRVSLSMSREGDTDDSPNILDNEKNAECYENRPASEVPRFLSHPRTEFISGVLIEQRFEDRRVKHHSIFSSLMTPHELSPTTQTQKETSMTDGNEVMLKGNSCRLQPARMRYIPPPIDYPHLIMKPRYVKLCVIVSKYHL
ncbi:hypothetical protein ElyMa_001320600 [Elysia marginata]|uniref:Uncharacterized protein n=1 Tax=Elysia marginata TaxID=1093978 RepID=A0AAV4IM12_9GAST|nr:hypothetical protein ElyMa_001320600 [Elysia marginata]